MKKWFEYHCYEGEDSSDAKLWHHTHQQVEVIARLKDTEVPMYKVRFNDGFQYDVFNDELMEGKSGFCRPDYVSSS